MVALFVAFGMVVLLALASLWADRRFRQEDRLPMQWSLAGKVNWTAPRRMALAFTPVLGCIVLASTAILLLVDETLRGGREDESAPVILLIGFAFLGAHALHLYLIDRSLRRPS